MFVIAIVWNPPTRMSPSLTIYEERKNEYEYMTIRIAMIPLGVSVIATIANLIASFL